MQKVRSRRRSRDAAATFPSWTNSRSALPSSLRTSGLQCAHLGGGDSEEEKALLRTSNTPGSLRLSSSPSEVRSRVSDVPAARDNLHGLTGVRVDDKVAQSSDRNEVDLHQSGTHRSESKEGGKQKGRRDREEEEEEEGKGGEKGRREREEEEEFRKSVEQLRGEDKEPLLE
eukprot:759443-Hanusia_phi.AAC.1